MITVDKIMTREVITISPDTEIVKAARLLLEEGFNGLPVIDAGGNLLGIICQSDIIAQQKRVPVPSLFAFMDGFFTLSSTDQLEKEAKKVMALTVADAMTENPITVTPDTGIEAVAQLMVDNNFHTLPVVEKGKVIGVVGKEDILRTIVSSV